MLSEKGTRKRYFNARWYSPERGMFTGRDAKLQFWTPYGFIGNIPLAGVDPTGDDALLVITGISRSATGYSAGVPYSYNSYLMNVYLNTEKWDPGSVAADHTPSAQFWVGRDAWKPEVNKAVVTGEGEVDFSNGAIGGPKGWLAISNNDRPATFTGFGPNGEGVDWKGLSFHPGFPENSEGCVTLGTPSNFQTFKSLLLPDLKSGNSVDIQFQSFVPEAKP